MSITLTELDQKLNQVDSDIKTITKALVDIKLQTHTGKITYSVRECAAATGLKIGSIRKLVKDGKLKVREPKAGEKIMLISAKSLYEFCEEPMPKFLNNQK